MKMSEPGIMQVRQVELEEVVERCDRLARAVLDAGFVPDTVVAVARGGFMPARFLCDFLEIRKLCSIRVQHYAAGAHSSGEARVTIPLSADIAGARVLLVDDVNDSGETLAVAGPYLESFSPAAVRTAVLHEKSSTRHLADFRAEEIRQWHWLLYPWAMVEDVGQFIRDMHPAPRSVAEIRQRLLEQYGFVPSPAQLDRVLHFNRVNLGGGRQ
jgi:uncharacterized protein